MKGGHRELKQENIFENTKMEHNLTDFGFTATTGNMYAVKEVQHHKWHKKMLKIRNMMDKQLMHTP